VPLATHSAWRRTTVEPRRVVGAYRRFGRTLQQPGRSQCCGRDPHIGLDRLTTNTDGDFRWDEYFTETVPKVLRGFRYFMRQLNDHYAAWFKQPRADLPRIEIVDGIDFVLGPDDDA
jgi:hypothetical protein